MRVTDGINFLLGGIIAALTFIFGENWALFAIFLLFNIADWITGVMKSRMAGKENSVKGWQGVAKKLGYWMMMFLAFALGYWLIAMGKLLGLNFRITTMLGWFVLASLTVNELRSILENFVEAGFEVPRILVEGLEVADKVVNKHDDAEKLEEVHQDDK